MCCAPQGISDVLVGEDVALERGGHVVQVIERDGHIFGVAVAVEHGEEGPRVLEVHRWDALIFGGHELHETGVGLEVLGAPLRVRPGKRELVDQRYDAHCRISELGYVCRDSVSKMKKFQASQEIRIRKSHILHGLIENLIQLSFGAIEFP